MGLSRESRRADSPAPLKAVLKITASLLVLALAVWFIVSPGEYSLFGLFDRFFLAGEEEPYEGDVHVNATIGVLSYPPEFDDAIEQCIIEFFREFYADAGYCEVEIAYLDFMFHANIAEVAIRESGAAEAEHLFILKKSKGTWSITGHENPLGA